ncbi:hypothetical protein LPJ60_004870 [Coemansia sp. RSA 2675]|uniref:Uncharacterized protein n=1 Tax=Coemansia linderi TaxID=2663919 RepID=A0ACC1KJ28_9FUNG|nr:hypothetical protein LPJ60_004870 [Coemansia sp. RSA 2675]KAJ2790845.1 hypothetical protein GGI18_001543 [Coemansia linderi]
MKVSTIALAAVATASGGALGFEKYVLAGSSAAGTTSFVNYVVSQPVQGKSAVVCTGAFISPTVLVTSAKCVTDSVSNKALAIANVLVGQGNPAETLKNITTNGAIDPAKVAGSGYVNPVAIFSHPGYNSIAFTDNIAVLTLAQPMADATSTKLIVSPSVDAGAAYTALGLSTSTSASSPLQQVSLKVGNNATCSGIWAPYAKLTNSLCLTPVKTASNVCGSDALLIKTAADKSVGLAGLLNIVAAKGDVPTSQCDEEGAADYFTTFANYVSWMTQITPLKQSDFVSSATYDYANSGQESSSSSPSSSQTDSDSESESGSESSRSSSASGLSAAGSLAVFVSAIALSMI